MKHVLLDTNILADQLFRRKSDGDPSLELIRLCQRGELIAYTTPWCLLTVMYLMGEATGARGARVWTNAEIQREAGQLLSFITLIEAGNGHFAAGFTYGWPDWEDAVIHALADGHPQIEVVITNDKEFVKRSKKLDGVPALLPADALKRLKA